ncbi:hypothetical protein AHiyo6_32290 [Arthrobacter sp. Hiyo6]|jgi:hypothetical protein|nr:hypothetical protein AHiyo6_32290 [Arthrobacter sp. Hiyo6]
MRDHAIFPDFSAFQMDLPFEAAGTEAHGQHTEPRVLEITATVWPDLLAGPGRRG